MYNRYTNIAKMVDDCVSGEYTIKSKGITYLPALSGMNQVIDGVNLYQIYKDYAKWFPATGRTHSTFLGMLFKKTPQHNMDDENTDLLSSFSDKGDSADGVAKQLSSLLMKNGLCAMLVDLPNVNTEGLTVKEFEAQDVKPFATIYDIYQILCWKYENFNGKKKLRYVALEEIYEVDTCPYQVPSTARVVDGNVTILRELILSYGIYHQTVKIENEVKNAKKDNKYTPIAEFTPIMDGSPLNYIPIVPISNHGLIFEYDEPMLYDIASVNLCDYRTDALYRNSLFYLGRPTPCVAGLRPFDDDSQHHDVLALGSSTFLEFEHGGQWGMLGGDANSSAALREELSRLKTEMSVIGSRSLAGDPTQVEAAKTAEIHRVGEHGTLSTVANIVSRAMNRAFYIMFSWRDTSKEYFEEDMSYSIQTDYIPKDVNPQVLTMLFDLYLSKKVPIEMLYHNLRKTEIIPDTMTIDVLEGFYSTFNLKDEPNDNNERTT